uniref:Uncharacterized protein n=1 Tax=Salix viminalis TaxID=40686 RepID=A0A6N2N5W3_SALVM
MFATIILLYGGVRYEVSKPDSLTDSLPRRRTSRNDVEFDFLDPLFTHQLWPPRHRLLRCIYYLPLLSFPLLCLTDLEVDQMDPFVATANINRWILIEFALQAALSTLLLFTVLCCNLPSLLSLLHCQVVCIV